MILIMMMIIIMVTDLFFIWLGSDNSCGQTAAEPKASHSNILTAQCVVAQMLHKMLHMCCIVARLCNTCCTIFCTMLYNCCTNVHCPPFWISTALLHSQNHTTVPLARAVQCRAICWYCVGKAFSARCTALCCYLTLGGGIQVVDSTRKLNANILQQNQHNQREVFKMGLEKTQSCEGGFLREKKRECMSLYNKNSCMSLYKMSSHIPVPINWRRSKNLNTCSKLSSSIKSNAITRVWCPNHPNFKSFFFFRFQSNPRKITLWNGYDIFNKILSRPQFLSAS